jgi:glycosyltransferase involved in cell wall biosynthesis
MTHERTATSVRVAVLWLGDVSRDTAGRTYLTELLGPLARQPGLTVDLHLRDRAFAVPAGCNVVWHDVPDRLGPFGRILAEPLVAASRLRSYDVLFAPFTNLPRSWRGPSVTAAHNVLAFGDRLRSELGLLRALYRPRALRQSLRRATRLLVVSGYLRDLLIEHFELDAARIDVVPYGGPPLRDDPEPRPVALDAPQVVAAAALYPYKRVDQAIEAFAIAFGDLPGARLRIAGPGVGDERIRLDVLARERGVADRVEFLGNVPHAQLLELFDRSDALLYLSEIESFGLPVLEAMARSLPVIAKPVMGLAEVGGDGPVWVAPDASADDVAEALERAVRDPELRAACAARGRVQAGRFTWERAAATTAEAIRAAGGHH